jgi:hypothetical protein
MASRSSEYMILEEQNTTKDDERYARQALVFSTTVDLDQLLVDAGKGMKHIPVMYFYEKKA